MAKKTLTLKEAYLLLEISRDATLDEVKQAYRRRAFALHPDLHPDNANAAAEFQRVNEAYVAIISYLDIVAKKQSAKAQFVNTDSAKKRQYEAQKRQAEQKRAEEKRREEERKRKERERAERAELERREMERRQARERAKREEERRRLLQEKINKELARIKAKQEAERQKLIKNLEEKAKEFRTLIIEQMEAVRRENEALAQKYAQKFDQNQTQNQTETQEQPQLKKVNNSYNANGEGVYNKYAGNYEQVVQNAFATIHGNGQDNGQNAQSAQNTHENTAQNTAENSSQETAFTTVDAGQGHTDETQKKNQKEYFTGQEISVTKENSSIPQAILRQAQEPLEGLKRGISSWFKSQIDEELELFFPAAKLQPGVKMRLQFRVGLANELQTIELTLPKDFVPGKTMRLKGLGKKIGKWQGDLYLKLQAK